MPMRYPPKKNINIFYCGQDPVTLKTLLESNQVNVSGVADISEFTDVPIKCWADAIFKCLYRLKKRNSLLTPFFKLLHKYSYRYSSFSFKKCAGLLQLMTRKSLRIINITDELSFRKFCIQPGIDLLVVNNWSMLAEFILKQPKFGTINVHPSNLPAYRGALPTLWSLKNNDKSSAVSFMQLAKGMDIGNIIEQIEFIITDNDDALSLEKKIDAIVEKNIVNVIISFIELGHITKQEPAKASYTEKYYPYMKIDWIKEKPLDIVNKINLYPYLWPFDFCYSEDNNRKIFYCEATFKTTLPANITLSHLGDCFFKNSIGYIKANSGYICVKLHQ